MAISISINARNSGCNALVDLIDVGGQGSLVIRDGSQPATCTDANETGATLATVTLPATAFSAAGSAGGQSDGVAAMLGVPLGVAASGTGTAGWFRIYDGGGGSIMDGSCGQGSGDLSLNNSSIVATGTLTITGFTASVPGS